MLNKLSEFLDAFIDQILNICTWIIDSILNLFMNLFYIIIDVFLKILELLISSIDFVEIESLKAFNNWGLLPPQVLYVLYKINFTQILTILAAAYMIRKILDLIPAAFTRV